MHYSKVKQVKDDMSLVLLAASVKNLKLKSPPPVT